MKWQFEISDCPENSVYPVVAYSINDSGVKRGPYYLSPESLKQALDKEPENLLDADNIRSNESSTPPLPFGTIRYSANGTKSRERVTMEIPQKQWEIRYGDKEHEYFSIGFPRMIVQYLVANNSDKKVIKEMRIYAVLNNNQPITDDADIYVFPYPNVGKSNGIVCWGQNERLELSSLVELERAFRWFVASPFNEDHGVRTTLGVGQFQTLIEVIKDQPFNDDWLMPLNIKYSELI